jgi:hypothetical protein
LRQIPERGVELSPYRFIPVVPGGVHVQRELGQRVKPIQVGTRHSTLEVGDARDLIHASSLQLQFAMIIETQQNDNVMKSAAVETRAPPP